MLGCKLTVLFDNEMRSWAVKRMGRKALLALLPFFLLDQTSDPEAWDHCKIAGANGSSPTILDGVGTNMFDSIFLFSLFLFFLQVGYFVSTLVIFTSVSQQRCLFLYLGAEAFCRRWIIKYLIRRMESSLE